MFGKVKTEASLWVVLSSAGRRFVIARSEWRHRRPARLFWNDPQDAGPASKPQTSEIASPAFSGVAMTVFGAPPTLSDVFYY